MKKLLVIFVLLSVGFSGNLIAKPTTIVCTIQSAYNSQSAETIDPSTWADKSWIIDTNKKVVKAPNGVKWTSEFNEEEIKWGLCRGEEDGGKSIQGSCASGTDGSKHIFKGWIYTLNRNNLSYQECINENAWMCWQRHKGYCQISKEKLL